MTERHVTYRSITLLADALLDERHAIESFLDENLLPKDIEDRFRNVLDICDILLDRAVDSDIESWHSDVEHFLVEAVKLILDCEPMVRQE